MKALLKKWWLLSNLLCFLLIGNLQAQTFQNIVPNGSFELYNQCPNIDGQIYLSPPWTGPTTNSSDYYNSCSNILNVPYYAGTGSSYPAYLEANEGNAYAGIYVYSPQNYREYLQVRLKDSLIEQQCFYVEFYAANTQYIPFAVNNIAVHFSAAPYSTTLTMSNSLLNISSDITNYGNTVITDTVKWKKIAGIYTSQGNEKYLTIGNFNTEANTDTTRLYPLGSNVSYGANAAYVFIDAVSMYSLDPHGTLPWSYRDTIINEDDSVFIGNQMGGLNFHPKWYKADGTYITTNAGITVKPETTSKYVIEFDLCGVTRRDTVKVTVIPKLDVGINKLNKLNSALKIYPQPASEVLNLENEMIADGEVVRLSIENSFAQIVKKEDVVFRNRKAKIKIDDLANGVYFVTLKTQNNESIIEKMVFAN